MSDVALPDEGDRCGCETSTPRTFCSAFKQTRSNNERFGSSAFTQKHFKGWKRSLNISDSFCPLLDASLGM